MVLLACIDDEAPAAELERDFAVLDAAFQRVHSILGSHEIEESERARIDPAHQREDLGLIGGPTCRHVNSVEQTKPDCVRHERNRQILDLFPVPFLRTLQLHMCLPRIAVARGPVYSLATT